MVNVIPFKEFISENYKNLIGVKSHEKRLKYAGTVWKILQDSYAKIGGIHGSGFESIEDIIEKIPFWKLYTDKDDVVRVVIMYKDSGGRKIVATGTDGSDFAKKTLAKNVETDLGISFGERSKASLGFLMKNVSFEKIKPFLIKPEVVSKILGKYIIPIGEYDLDKLDSFDKVSYDKFPQLRDFFYIREIGNENHLKLMVGTPGLTIV